jgi:glycosyltransferase involved in cell wall biosynthesis
MSAPLRSLMITPILPDKTGNGLSMRMGVFAEALAQLGPLVIIVLPVAGSAISGNDFTKSLGARVHFIDVTTHTSAHFMLVSRLADPLARIAAFKAYGQPSLARGLTPPVLEQITRILAQERPDLVHIGRSYLIACASLLPTGTQAVLDLDEDDYTSYLQQAKVAKASGDTYRADWLEQEAIACDALISNWKDGFHRIFVASKAEARTLRARHNLLNVSVIENAIAVPALAPRQVNTTRILFVGSLSYAPNSDGMIWFLERVLPRLRARLRTPVFIDIVGSMAPRRLVEKRGPNIRLHGFVSSLTDFYKRSTIAIAPLHAGGGTRIKLLEASAYGLASVATEVASAGLGYDVGWTANSSEAFATCVSEAIHDNHMRDRRARKARQYVQRHYTRDAVMVRICQAVTGYSLGSETAGRHTT